MDTKPAEARRTPVYEAEGRQRSRGRESGRGRPRCCGIHCALRVGEDGALLVRRRRGAARYRCIFCPWRERSERTNEGTVMHAKAAKSKLWLDRSSELRVAASMRMAGSPPHSPPEL